MEMFWTFAGLGIFCLGLGGMFLAIGWIVKMENKDGKYGFKY